MRKYALTNKDVIFYEITSLGYVNVLVVGPLPYPGWWQFDITPNEYGFNEPNAETRLLELLKNYEEQEDWTLRGCSCSCSYAELISEVKDVIPDLSIDEKILIEKTIGMSLKNKNIIIKGKYNEKTTCTVIDIMNNGILRTKDTNGNKIEVSLDEILDVLET